MLSAYRYARGRRGWLEVQQEGNGHGQLLPQGTLGSPDPQNTDALSPTPLSSQSCVLNNNRQWEVLWGAVQRERVPGATPKDKLTRVCGE